MVASTNSNGISRPVLTMSSTSMNDGRTNSRGRFFNALDARMKNTPNSIKENYECYQCGKRFGNQHILQLHTRIHESQSLLRDVPGATATLVNTTHLNGVLSFNFNISLDISSNDHQGMTLKERLTNIFKSDNLWENVSQSLADLKCLSEMETPNILPSESATKHQKTEDETVKSSNVPSVTEHKINSLPEVLQNNIESSIGGNIQSKKETGTPGNVTPSEPLPSPVKTPQTTRGRKTVGLTKIRLEDCRRCDACSCIYMDERDYIKHMKNFHKHDVSSIPLEEKDGLNFRPFRHKQDPKRLRQTPSPPQKKSCRSCCKQCKCRGNHDTLQPMFPILRPVLGRQTNRTQSASDGILPFDIKDRWNKVVTQRLTEDVPAAFESTGPDISDLLSQVEVKIKTEPMDLLNPPTCVEETYPLVAVKEERLDIDMLEF